MDERAVQALTDAAWSAVGTEPDAQLDRTAAAMVSAWQATHGGQPSGRRGLAAVFCAG